MNGRSPIQVMEGANGEGLYQARLHPVHGGALAGYRKYGFLLFVLDHNAGVDSALHHRCQG